MSAVDIVVPCYNYAHFLPDCVESVLSQEGVSVRVLIMDDCSPDNTAEVGQKLAAADPRVTYVRNDVNRGVVATINRGLFEWVGGDYALMLSADDVLTPGALGRAAGLMDKNPQVGMVYGPVVKLAHGAPARGAAVNPDAEQTVTPGKEFFRASCDVGNDIPAPAVVVRTRLQHEIGPYDAEFPHAFDYDMWLRFALRGDVGYINTYQAYYRLHPSQMSTAFLGASAFREHMALMTKLVDAHPAEMDGLQGAIEAYRRFWATRSLHEAHRNFDSGNAPAVDELVAAMVDLGIPLRDLPPWRSLQVKRMIGLGGYNAVKPVLEFVRRNARAPQAPR